MTEITTLVGFAVGAGVATFFSPCAYGLLPAYLGYFANDVGDGRPSLVGAGQRGLASGIGAFGAFMALGGVGVLIGDLFVDVIPVLEVTIGLLLGLLGVSLLLDRSPSVTVAIPRPVGSLPEYVVFGAGYAAAGAGCVAPIFLGLIVAAVTAPLGIGLATMAVYASTFAGLLVAVTLVGSAGIEFINDHVGFIAGRLTVIAGAMILLGGILQVAVGLGWSPPTP